jgi:NAD(P)-dependent dehydrogenase (short-subunit alcohol dehydrogenase family)
MQERDVKGKNFVFSGGSHGMGRAAALALAQRGANILIVSRGAPAGERAASDARAAGAASAQFLAADLSTVAGIQVAAEAIKSWQPHIHGLMHTAMAAFNQRIVTSDKLDFAFALQYLARASLNRLLKDQLAASGDGRVVHIAGNVSGKMASVDLDDLQFEHRKWSFFKSILGTHHLGFLHLQEASKRWHDLPVTLAACCVESVKTKAMTDPEMPFIMRLMGRFGTTAELASRNAVTMLTTANTDELKGGIARKSKVYAPEKIDLNAAEAQRLWQITTDLAAKYDMTLPD